jgi:hypothetical protein
MHSEQIDQAVSERAMPPNRRAADELLIVNVIPFCE